MLKQAFKTLLLGLIFLVSPSWANKPLTAEEIIQRANLAAYYAGDDGKAQARMIIVDENQQKQMRQFTILRKDKQDSASQDFLVFFAKPSNVKNTVFRVEKHLDKDDNRWLYLPALDLLKRISAGDKRTSFVGSHFFYEDVSGRNPQQDSFELLANNESSYQLKGVPRNPDSVEFASYIVTIDKQSFLPMETTYYNQQHKATRKMQVLKVAMIDNIATVLKSRMTDLTNNSYTDLQFRRVTYNNGIPDSIFSERSMRTPPKAWLK